MGINFIRKLVSQGHSVVSLDREPFEYEDMMDKVDHVQGDIRDREVVNRCMKKGVEVVMHGAAALPLCQRQDIMTSNVEGTENVLSSAWAHGCRLAIYISSTAVYGIPKKHPLFEDDPLVGVGSYGKSKIQAERRVKNYREKGMIIPIIRPKSFVGPERLGVFAIFYQWASEGRSFPMIGRGRNLYQLLDVEDLCDAIIMASQHSRGDEINTEFNIGAKAFSTMREDYQVVLDRAGFGKKIREFPASLAVMGLEVLDFFGLSPLYPWVYKTATRDSFVSVEKAEKTFSFSPQFSNQDALLRNFEWFLANRERISKSAGNTHRVAWRQGVLGLAKYMF